jgi:hypothetical protein
MTRRAPTNTGSSVKKPSAKGLDRLVQCLHRYVEVNGGRFDTLTENIGLTCLVTFVVAKEKPTNEDRVLRPIQLG